MSLDVTMRSGELRHRVSLQSYTEVRNNSRQLQSVWVTDGNYWSFVEPLSGRELLLAQQIRAETTHRITFRYGVPIKPVDRVIYNNRAFNVLSVYNDKQRNYKLVCLAIEVFGLPVPTYSYVGLVDSFVMGSGVL